MARRFARLSGRQLEVLRWAADGCPDGVWQDFSYKTTAYALAGRALVTVNRRRDLWRAAITEDGCYYLEHGTYRPAGAPQAARVVQQEERAPAPGPELLITAESLLSELGGGRRNGVGC